MSWFTKSPKVANSNIYAGLVSRNIAEPTYEADVNGDTLTLHPAGRTSHGDVLRSTTPTFAARQPKGMLLRTSEGPTQVHMATKN